MTVSNQPVSLLDSVLKAHATRQEIGVEVLKMAQDTVQQQGEAVVEMLEQSVPPAGWTGLDVYA
ncbi:MAG TPA: YjfB family protein [Clostridia bacterium]|nr:YjfB family protein [Clostridia bacterium]